MFAGVNEKLERAGYFLSNLKALAEDAGGFAYIKRDKQQEMRANLDGFFFEIISAKDFFLQGVNNGCGLGLEREKATKIAQLKGRLKGRLSDLENPPTDTIALEKALQVVTSIGRFLDNKDSWLWRLSNYRNSATHRELLHVGHEVKATITVEKHLFDKIRQGKAVIKLIYEGEEKEISPEVPKVDIPRENIKTYLFKDPEDPSKGNADMEVIPYCEQSLTRMKEFLEGLYSELELE